MFFFEKRAENQDNYLKNTLEPVLLFCVFFLPGYLSQSSGINSDIFNSLSFNILYVITILPQILLLLYIINLDKNVKFTDFGIIKFRAIDIPKALLTLLGIFLCLIPVFILLIGISIFSETLPINNIAWKLDSLWITPLVLVTCILIGYSEELFFRSYLITRFTNSGIKKSAAVCVSVFLFSIGHIYQGIPGFIGTAVIGLFLSYVFLIYRNIHIIAIAHGLYNFSILFLTFFLPSF